MILFGDEDTPSTLFSPKQLTARSWMMMMMMYRVFRFSRGSQTSTQPLLRSMRIACFFAFLTIVLAALISAEEELLCPYDYTIVKRLGVSNNTDELPIQLVRQAGDFVEFQIFNAWSLSTDGVLEHLCVTYNGDPLGSKDECTLEEGLSSTNSSKRITAYCTPKGESMVHLYARDTSFSSSLGSAKIPKCCLETDHNNVNPTLEHMVKISCNVKCSNPGIFVSSPIPEPSIKTLNRSFRENVYGILLNGPFQGAQHPWAWKPPGQACSMADKNNVEPCGIDSRLLDRVLKFESSFFDFEINFDNDITSTLSLASDKGQDMTTFFPAKSNAQACDAPLPNTDLREYPIRMVRSGNYLHHWYVDSFNCDTSTRLEIKVTSDW
jgi:hypothetical protein